MDGITVSFVPPLALGKDEKDVPIGTPDLNAGILSLAKKGGALTEQRLADLRKILTLANSRIKDANRNYLVLALSIMLVESTLDARALNKKTGAIGLMQLMPLTMVDILTRLIKPDRQGDRALYAFFDKFLTAEIRKAFENIRQIDAEIIPHGAKDLPARLKERAHRFAAANKLAAGLIAGSSVNGQVGQAPEFNVGLGVFLLAKICQQAKGSWAGKEVSAGALRKALAAYSNSRDQSYGNKVIATFKMISSYPGIIPFIAGGERGKLGINNALEIHKNLRELLFQIISQKITPDKALKLAAL